MATKKMKLIFEYVDKNIFWVIIVATIFWFASWYLSAFPPLGILFLIVAGIYMVNSFRREFKNIEQYNRKKPIKNQILRIVLFLFLIYILSGLAKGVAFLVSWVFVWITNGEAVAEALKENKEFTYYQLDYYVAIPTMVIILILFFVYLKRSKSEA